MFLFSFQEEESIIQFIDDLNFFKYITKASLEGLVETAVEKVFEKNFHLVRENEPATSIYVIRKGCVTITGTSNYKKKVGIGAITQKLELVNGSPNYTSSNVFHSDVIADTTVQAIQLNLEKLKRIVAKSPEFEAFIWRDCFEFLVKDYSYKYPNIASLESETIAKIVGYCDFKKGDALSIEELPKGGVLLRGKICEYNEGFNWEQYLAKEGEDALSIKNKQTALESALSQEKKLKKYDSFSVFLPNEDEGYKFFVVTKCAFFFFTDDHEINGLITETRSSIRPSRYVK